MNTTRFVSVDPHEAKKASVTHAEIDIYLRTRTWSFSAPLFQSDPADLPAEQAIHEVIARFILAGSNHFPTQNEIRAMILRIKTDALKRDDLFLFPELNNDGLAQWNHKVRTDFEYFEHPQRHPETTLTVRGLYRKSTNSTAPHFEVTPLERFPDLLLRAHLGNGNEHLNRDAMYRYMKQNLSKSIPKALCMDFIKACPNPKCKNNVTNAQNSKAKHARKVEAGEIPRKERKNAKRPRDHVNDHNKPVKRSRNPRGAAVAPQMCQHAVGIPGQPAMPGQAAWQMGQGQDVNIHNQFGNGDVYNHPLPAGPYQNQHYPDVPENNGPAPYYPQVNAGQPEIQPNADTPEPNFPAYYNILPRVPPWPHVTGAPFLNFQRPAEPFLPQPGEDQQLAALLIDYNNRHDEYGQVREQPAAFNAFNDVQCHAGQSREQPASFNSYNDHQVSFEQLLAQLGVANAFNTVQDQVGHVQEQFADTKAYNNHQVNFEQPPAQPNASGAFPSGAFWPSGAFQPSVLSPFGNYNNVQPPTGQLQCPRYSTEEGIAAIEEMANYRPGESESDQLSNVQDQPGGFVAPLNEPMDLDNEEHNNAGNSNGAAQEAANVRQLLSPPLTLPEEQVPALCAKEKDGWTQQEWDELEAEVAAFLDAETKPMEKPFDWGFGPEENKEIEDSPSNRPDDRQATQPEAPAASESHASNAARRYNGRPLGGLRAYGLTDKTSS